MFGIQHYASFIAAIIAFQLAPGAGTLAVVNAAARNGFRGGMCSVFGTLLGDFVYMTASVLGLAAILTTYPTVFVAMQWLGGAYLCWIGIGLLLERIVDRSETATSAKTNGFYFRQAFTVALTNPKVVMFFMAFFPVVHGPERPPSDSCGVNDQRDVGLLNLSDRSSSAVPSGDQATATSEISSHDRRAISGRGANMLRRSIGRRGEIDGRFADYFFASFFSGSATSYETAGSVPKEMRFTFADFLSLSSVGDRSANISKIRFPF